jgi:uncharacterized protein YndB with AHSA1/START domain
MTPKTKSAVVRLQRRIPAPPPQVYRAWLDPALLRQWMAPGGLEVTRAEVEGRVGGRLRVWHAEAGSAVGGFECEIVELVPDERLVFRWGFVGPDRAGPVHDSRLTITLEAAGGNATTLTLVHERLDDLAAALSDVAKNVEVGWSLALDKLVMSAAPGHREEI